MSFKHDLFKNSSLSYIPSWDFSANLDMAEGSMLCYLIDNDDFKHANGGWFELTPGYIQRKRPSWSTSSIRNSLKALVKDGYIIKKEINSGRGNFYRLNKDKIIKDLVMPFLENNEKDNIQYIE